MLKKAAQGFFAEIKTTPEVLQSSHFPSLDGIRGIAIIMVLLFHLRLSGNYFYATIFNGKLGVIIFFVLSGMLITTLCIKEKVATNDISLKNFYIRRALRIFPVAYLYIIVVVILNYVFKLKISYINIIGTCLYLMNFTSFFRKYYSTWFTGHFWSLSVEEQFYLFIPFILKRKFKAYLGVILAIIIVLPLFICLQYLFPVLNGGILYAFTHYLIKFQGIAVGCLFSVLLFKYPVSKWVGGRFKAILNILAFILILVIPYDDLFNLPSVFTGLVICILIGYIIISNVSPGNDFVFRFLNTKALKTIGVLSYSIYIWQQLFTSVESKLPMFMTTAPYNIICILVTGCCSYYFYERAFLKLKSKFSRINQNQVPATDPVMGPVV
jgi:peptidoglycan/LPS O-acetylase OafA/YrhL